VRIALGPQWLNAVPLVRIFALVCTLRVIAYFSSVLLNAQGLIRTQFQVLLTALLVRAALLAMLVPRLGLEGVALAATGCIAIEETLFLIVTFRRFRLSAAALVRCSWRSLVAAGVMAMVLIAEHGGWRSTEHITLARGWYDLVIGTISGAVVYTGVILFIWWISGRPRGAEATVLGVLTTTVRGLLKPNSKRPLASGH
jgi:PST family polysaccharide transporter